MPISIAEITEAVTAYLDRFPNERDQLQRLTTALVAGVDVTTRAEFTGHVTCSAALVGPGERVLHIHHNDLRRWLRPGGHLEPDDTTLYGAALRELAEETGIPATTVTPLDTAQPLLPLDIDVHPIPANAAKDEPGHWHYDLCYALRCDHIPEVLLQPDEVNQFAWLTLSEMDHDGLPPKLYGLLTPAAPMNLPRR